MYLCKENKLPMTIDKQRIQQIFVKENVKEYYVVIKYYDGYTRQYKKSTLKEAEKFCSQIRSDYK